MVRTEERIAYFVNLGYHFYDHIPDGWKVVKGALTAPSGYVWIHRFVDGYRKTAFAKI